MDSYCTRWITAVTFTSGNLAAESRSLAKVFISKVASYFGLNRTAEVLLADDQSILTLLLSFRSCRRSWASWSAPKPTWYLLGGLLLLLSPSIVPVWALRKPAGDLKGVFAATLPISATTSTFLLKPPRHPHLAPATKFVTPINETDAHMAPPVDLCTSLLRTNKPCARDEPEIPKTRSQLPSALEWMYSL